MNDVEYYFYVGEDVPSMSLWRREGDEEFPIYANTLGRGAWYSSDAEVSKNVDEVEPSDAFWDALKQIASRISTDVDGCEWYEQEVLNMLGRPAQTPEQRELIRYAMNTDNE